MRIIFSTLIVLIFSFDVFSLELASKDECQDIITASEKLANQNFKSNLRININLDGKESVAEVVFEYRDGNAELISKGNGLPDIDEGDLGMLLSPIKEEDCEFIYLDGHDLLVKISKGDSLMMSRKFNYEHDSNTLTPINMTMNVDISVLFIDYSIKTNFHFENIEFLEVK